MNIINCIRILTQICKRLFFVLCALAIFIVIVDTTSSFTYANSTEKNKEPQEEIRLKIGILNADVDVHENFASEFCIPVIKHIAQNNDWQIDIIDGKPDYLYEQLLIGNLDILLPIPYSEKNDTLFLLSKEPFINTWAQVITNENNTLNSFFDLEGKNIALLEDDIISPRFEQLLDEFGFDADIRYENNLEELFGALEQNSVDAVVCERLEGYFHTIHDNVKPTPIVFQPFSFHIAANKDIDFEIILTIEAELIDMKSDVYSMYNKKLHSIFSASDHRHTVSTLRIIIYVLIGIGFLLLFYYIFNLRKKSTQSALSIESLNSKLADFELVLRNNKVELQQITNLYDQVLENIENIIIIFDTNGKIIELNKTAKKVLQIFETKANHNSIDFNNPTLQKILSYDEYQGLIESEQSIKKEVQLTINNNAFRYRISVKPIYKGDSLIALFILGINVEKSKSDQEQLLLYGSLSHAQTKSAIDGCLIINSNGKVLEYNQIFLNIWSLNEVKFSAFSKKELFEYFSGRIINKELFLESYLRTFRRNKTEKDILQSKDGKIIERYSFVTDSFSDNTFIYVFYFRDTTSILRAEEEALEAKERFRNITESIPDIVYRYYIYPELTCDYMSPSALEITGYSPEEYKANATITRERTHPDDVLLLDEIFGNLKDYLNKPFHLRFLRKDGVYIILEHRISPIYESEGTLIGYDGITRDITEKMKAEQALRDSEKRLKLTLEAANEGLFEWNLKTEDVYFSPRYYTMLGYKPNEFKPSYEQWTKLLHPDDRERSEKYIMDFIQQDEGQFELEFRLKRKNGTYSWILAKGNIIAHDDDGKPLVMAGTHVDIEKRKKAEVALQESNLKLEQLYNNSLDGIASIDTSGNFIQCNKSYEYMLGYTFEELQNLSIHDITPKKWHTFESVYLKKIFTEGSSGLYEKEYIRKNGMVFPVELNVYWIKDKDDVAIGAWGIVRDITEQKLNTVRLNQINAELERKVDERTEELTVSNEELQAEIEERKRIEAHLEIAQFSLDNISVAVMLIKQDASFLSYNNMAIEMYSINKIENPTILSLIPNYSEKDWQRDWEFFKVNRTLTFESVHQNSKKEKIPVEVIATFLKFSEKEYMVLFSKDISNRKEAEKALRESENKFRMLAETTTASIIISTDDQFLYVNPQFEEITGYNAVQLQKLNLFNLLHPEDVLKFEQLLQKLFKSELLNHHIEIRIVSKYEKVIWLALDIRLIEYENQNVYIGTAINITDRIIYENELDQHKNRLEEIVRDRTTELTREIHERKRTEQELLRAKEKAEESDKLKSSLLANMSHEFRTPLNGILGYAQLLEDILTEQKHRVFTGGIRKSGRRLMKILDSILQLATLESSSTVFLQKTVVVANEAKIAIEELQEWAEEKNNTITMLTEDPAACVYGSTTFLRNILTYLIDNAIKFTSEGNITVRIATEKQDNKKKTIIEVMDTGIGIEESAQDTIFGEFRQISEGWSRSYEGAGLGLALTKRMVELMKGEIRVKSKLNVGSTFILQFPSPETVDELNLTQSPKQKFDFNHDSNKRQPVLLIEDNDINALTTIKFLEDFCEIDWAQHSERAIDLAQNKHYKAVLVDINLGRGMNGIQVMNKIKENVYYQDIPFIAITGYAMPWDQEKLQKEGFAFYLPKPFTRKSLSELLSEALA